MAFENCSPKYKAVFAEPKGSTRTQRDQYGRLGDDNYSRSNKRGMNFDSFGGGGSGGGNGGNNSMGGGSYGNNDWNNASYNSDMSGFLRMQNVTCPQPTCLEIIASNQVNQDQLWRLFDIIPGLDYCQITRECKFKFLLCESVL